MLSATDAGQQIFLPGMPDYNALSACIHCGRCLSVCPTYQETTQEIQSPRGRLALLKAVADGEIDFSPAVEGHLHHCLDCRACNTVCPAGLPIGESIVAGRAAARTLRPPSRLSRALLGLLRRPALMERLFQGARLYAGSPLRRVAAGLRQRRLPGLMQRLVALEATLPDRIEAPLRPSLPPHLPAYGVRTHTVGYFVGCVGNVAFPAAGRATIELLRHAGCDVVPLAPGCCGSPHEHAGASAEALGVAQATIAAFEAHPTLDAIISDAAGCSGMLKSYPHLFHADPDWASRARAFSAKVRDATEFLDMVLPPVIGDAPAAGVVPTLTYHAPCHLANMQGIVAAPHRLLARLQGVVLVPLPDERRCCGSAGTYNITHPEMAQQLLDAKLDAIEATGATTLVSCNPGCQMHIAAGLRARGSRVAVRHLSEVLWEAMSAGTPMSIPGGM